MTSPEQQAVADRLRADRTVWRDVVAEVGRDRMNEPGPMGEWTFKDLVAHLGGWRMARLPMIEAIARGEAPPPEPWPPEMDDVDEVNAWLQERDRDRTLEDVLDEYDQSFERLAAAIEAMPESVAADPDGLPWAEGTPLIEIDFTEHLHDEHLR
ncbi:MAG: maleylpyruvate isomerase N-terminal domain-containing protein, partial [Chloroflexota bacterium]